MAPGAKGFRSAGYALALALAGVVFAAGGARAGSNTVLVFDASNSMNSPFDGGSRIEALKDAIAQSLPPFEGKLDLGLVAFGNREVQSCEDFQTLVPGGEGSASRVTEQARSITAQGVSAVAQTLQHAADAADYAERPASIILVADSSGVDNCVIDTCATATRLVEEAVDLDIHVIAVAPKADDVPHLQCMATASGGEFLGATSRASLAAALTQMFEHAAAQESQEIVIPPPRPKPVPPVALAELEPRPKPDAVDDAAATGDGNGDAGAMEEPVDEPAPDGAGSENVSVFAPTPRGSPAAPAAGGTTAPAQPDQIVIAATGDQAPSDAEAAPHTSNFAPTQPSQRAGTGDQPGGGAPASPSGQARTFVVSATPPAPPASTILVKRPGSDDDAPDAARAPTAATGSPPQTVAAAAPAAAEPAATPEAGIGKLRLAAFVVENTNAIPSDVEWQILTSAPNGTEREVVASSSDPSPEIELPSGNYFARATFGGATRAAPISVAANETASLDLVLNAGGLQINPVNAGTEEPETEVLNTIFAAGTTTRPVAENVGSGEVIYLNAGVYRVESRYGGANAVALADIEVLPGKLVKARINHRAGPAAFRLVAENSDEPLDGTVWQVLASDGTVVTRSDESTPRYVFAEGDYEVVAQHAGKTYRLSFEIRPGEETDVEVVAR